MSDGIHKLYDEEEDWIDFKTKYNLKDTGWDVYSKEASFAQTAVKKGLISTNRIKLYVRQQLEELQLKEKHRAEWLSLDQYEKLKL